MYPPCALSGKEVRFVVERLPSRARIAVYLSGPQTIEVRAKGHTPPSALDVVVKEKSAYEGNSTHRACCCFPREVFNAVFPKPIVVVHGETDTNHGARQKYKGRGR